MKTIIAILIASTLTACTQYPGVSPTRTLSVGANPFTSTVGVGITFGAPQPKFKGKTNGYGSVQWKF